MTVITAHLRKPENALSEITFVLYDDESVAVYQHELARIH